MDKTIKEFEELKEMMLKEKTNDPNKIILRMYLFLKLEIPIEMEDIKDVSEYASEDDIKKFNTDQLEILKNMYELIKLKKEYLMEFNSALDTIKRKIDRTMRDKVVNIL